MDSRGERGHQAEEVDIQGMYSLSDSRGSRQVKQSAAWVVNETKTRMWEEFAGHGKRLPFGAEEVLAICLAAQEGESKNPSTQS